MSYEYFIGARYLGTKKKNTFISLISLLSVAGVTIGVMALIVVISVMAGFESDLKSRILGIESHLIIMKYNGHIKDYQKIIKYTESLEGVEAASPFIYTQVMLRSSNNIAGAVIRGVCPETGHKVIKTFDPRLLISRASPDQEKNIPRIILGKELANKLGTEAGDQIYLISPGGMLSPIGHIPAMKRLEVAGTFESGMYEFDGSLAYVNIDQAMKILKTGGKVTGIEVRVKDIYKARDIGAKIEKSLGFPYWTKDWTQMNRNLFSALKLERTTMFIILALIIMVAAFNIASTLIMMVMQKTRDIAILKAMGATDRSIRKIFIFKGMSIGVIGTSLGVIFGLILCILLKHYKFIELPGDIYYISTLPVEIQILDVIIIAASALMICFIATLYPAHQAAKLDPVEAFRYG